MIIGKPEVLGFSSERLGRLDSVLERHVEERKSAGLVTLIYRRGQVAHLGCYGMADIESGAPMAPDTIFRMYSMTKPLTSVALLMLFEEGLLRLSDPVSQYIPAFKDLKVLDVSEDPKGILVEPKRQMTVTDLLGHNAGLAYGFKGSSVVDDLYFEKLGDPVQLYAHLEIEELIAKVAELPLLGHPGAQHRYSLSVDIQGYLVKLLSGMPLDEFLKKRMFEPLNMVDSSFVLPPEKIDRFAANYEWDEQSTLPVCDSPRTSPWLKPRKQPCGGGGLLSTMTDYLQFARMLLGKGEVDGVRLLGPKTIELATRNFIPTSAGLYDSGGTGFGLGFRVLLDLAKTQNLGSIGNFGWSGAAGTHFWVDPQEDMVAIFLNQLMGQKNPIVTDFGNLVYSAIVD